MIDTHVRAAMEKKEKLSFILVLLLILVPKPLNDCRESCDKGWECKTWVDPLGYSPTFSACEPKKGVNQWL